MRNEARPEKRACLHSHAYIQDRRNMFGGLNGRRRLKTIIAIVFAGAIIVTLISRNKGKRGI